MRSIAMLARRGDLRRKIGSQGSEVAYALKWINFIAARRFSI
jgi:hypothetical protein